MHRFYMVRSAFALLLIVLIASCSREHDPLYTIIEGDLIIPDSLVEDDFPGLGLTIVKRDSANADADTLFHKTVTESGTFSAGFIFKKEGTYPLIFSEGVQNLGVSRVILAHQDTIRLSASYPNIGQSLELESKQHRAMQRFNRTKRAYQRMVRIALQQELPDDSLVTEMKKFADLHWDFYEKYPKTYAGKLAAVESIEIRSQWSYDSALEKVRALATNPETVGAAARFAGSQMAAEEGYERAITFLDSLKDISVDTELDRDIDERRIQLLYESARVDEAETELAEYRRDYADYRDAKNWADDMGYDIAYLAPGKPIPPFRVETIQGDSLTSESLLGQPWILEVTQVVNATYQQQYDRSNVIHYLYEDSDLEFVTLPLDVNQVTVDAFFEERGGAVWPVATTESIDGAEILNQYNVNYTPTRFLIDREGKIVKKYVGMGFSSVIKDINSIQ